MEAYADVLAESLGEQQELSGVVDVALRDHALQENLVVEVELEVDLLENGRELLLETLHELGKGFLQDFCDIPLGIASPVLIDRSRGNQVYVHLPELRVLVLALEGPLDDEVEASG